MNVPHRILTPDEPSKGLGKTLERDSSVDCNFLAPAVAFADVCTRLSLCPSTLSEGGGGGGVLCLSLCLLGSGRCLRWGGTLSFSLSVGQWEAGVVFGDVCTRQSLYSNTLSEKMLVGRTRTRILNFTRIVV